MLFCAAVQEDDAFYVHISRERSGQLLVASTSAHAYCLVFSTMSPPSLTTPLIVILVTVSAVTVSDVKTCRPAALRAPCRVPACCRQRHHQRVAVRGRGSAGGPVAGGAAASERR